MIEGTEYRVTISVSTVVTFSPIERDHAITKHDAIENAMGMLPDGYFKIAEDEGFVVETEAERL